MKSSFRRYVLTIGLTTLVTSLIAFAIIGAPLSNAQPAGSAGSGSQLALEPVAGSGSAAASGSAATPAAGSAAAGSAAAGSAAAGSAAPPPAAAVPWYAQLADRPIEDFEGTMWMPTAVNKNALDSDNMFYAVYGLSIFFFFAIAIVVVYFTIKYRHRPGHKAEPSSAHNDALEITWTVIPTIICVFLFYYGWRTYVHVVTPPAKAVEINVTAWKWSWEFRHANGVKDKDLHVPVDTPVRLVMTSKDVLHAFYAPVMRTKQDIIPRRYTYAWFEATKPGTYRLTCAEYCGTDHSQMGKGPTAGHPEGRRTVVVVHERGDYERYLADKFALEGDVKDPVELGKRLYEAKNCISCHNIDGTRKIGPSFKGFFGKEVEVNGGQKVLMDEEFIRESLATPAKKIRDGYQNQMTPFADLSEKEVQGIIAFIKSLNPPGGK